MKNPGPGVLAGREVRSGFQLLDRTFAKRLLEPIQNLFPRSVAPPAAGQTVTAPHPEVSSGFLHLNGLSSSPEARLTFQKKILDGFLETLHKVSNPLFSFLRGLILQYLQ